MLPRPPVIRRIVARTPSLVAPGQHQVELGCGHSLPDRRDSRWKPGWWVVCPRCATGAAPAARPPRS